MIPYPKVIEARDVIRKNLYQHMGSAAAERVNNIIMGLQNEELTYRDALEYIYHSLTPCPIHRGIEEEDQRMAVSIAVLGKWWIITRDEKGKE